MGVTGKVDASRAHGDWLRTQRQARGWSVAEMRRRLREAAEQAGDSLPGNDCLSVMIHRWEDDRSGISERYRLHYCRAFQIPIDEFGSLRARAASAPGPVPVPAVPARSGAARPDPVGLGRSSIELEIVRAAHEGIDHAQRTERRDAGEATLEHLRAEVVRLSHDYMTGEPLTLFFEARHARDQVYAALDRKLWPRDQADLYFLLGCLNHLMAVAADGLGLAAASEELARAGLAYALAIGHRPLTAQLRLGLAVTALYAGQPLRSKELAILGIDYLAVGANAAQLRLVQARAAARLGDAGTARHALVAAAEIRDLDSVDDVAGIGGQFSFSRASYHYYAGSAVADLDGGGSDAVTELGRAVEMYEAGPGPGEQHSLHCQMIARADLAATWLGGGRLDAAVSVAGPVLALPCSQRISQLSQRLARVRTVLAASRYQGCAQARDLDQQIAQFCRDSLAAQLRDLPGNPG